MQGNGLNAPYPWNELDNISLLRLSVCLLVCLSLLVQTWGNVEASSLLARSSASPSPAPWWGDPRFSSWTKPPAAWTSIHRKLYVLALIYLIICTTVHYTSFRSQLQSMKGFERHCVSKCLEHLFNIFAQSSLLEFVFFVIVFMAGYRNFYRSESVFRTLSGSAAFVMSSSCCFWKGKPSAY